MKHRATRSLYEYWRSRRAGRPAPSRAEIEPSDIHTLLSDTFILQCNAPGQAPFRLSGTRLCVMFDRELKGEDFLSLWNEHDSETLAAAVRILREDASCCLVRWQGVTDDARTLSGELVLLPLTMGGTQITRILGALASYELPYWLGTRPVRSLKIVSIRMIEPGATDRPPGVRKGIAALAEADVMTPGARRIGHLTVFDGGLRKS